MKRQNAAVKTIITVTNAWNQRGWSALDHQIDDSALTTMIGQHYTSLAELKRAAEERAQSYATVEFRDQYGDLYQWRGDARLRIPGRHVVEVQRVDVPAHAGRA